LVGSIIEGPL